MGRGVCVLHKINKSRRVRAGARAWLSQYSPNLALKFYGLKKLSKSSHMAFSKNKSPGFLQSGQAPLYPDQAPFYPGQNEIIRFAINMVFKIIFDT